MMSNINMVFTTVYWRLIFNLLLVLILALKLTYTHAQVCGTGTNLVAGTWTMISIPCQPSGNTVQDVFADDLGAGNYDLRWVVYERNEATDSYLKLTLASVLNQGESYWILSLDNATVGFTGTSTPLITGNANCPSLAGCFEAMMMPPDTTGSTRQNMAGHPFPFDVNWADVIVEVDGVGYTPSAAETAGLVSKTIHKYNGSSYSPFDDITPAMQGVLTIHDGFWVETLGGSAGKTVKLLIGDTKQPPVAQNDSYNFSVSADQNIAAGTGLFVDNGSGADTLGHPAAVLSHFGSGSLGGTITDNAAGASVALAGGTLTVNTDGGWSLTGQPFTPGMYTFDYRLTNTSGTSDATATLEIVAAAACNNDSYTATGNVGIDSTNGINQSVLFNDTGMPLSVTAFDAASNNGGSVNILSNGEFTYVPPAGYVGADSFTYTANTTLTCTVNLTVSDMIWFIDNSKGVNGNGTLNSPFNSLPNFNAGAADQPGDSIFVYRQTATNYTGPLMLLNNQILIGQGATDTIGNISGIIPAPLSDTLPAPIGIRPVIAHTTNNLTLGQNNTVRGLDLSNSGGTALTGNNFANLSLSEMSVSNTGGIAVSLANGNPGASFTSISASGGSNGIILNNTTGSFTVTGDGGGTQNASGGTIQNTSGDGIRLTNATNISLTQLNITDPASQADGVPGDDHAIDISSVTNFTYQDAIINGFGTTNSHDDQHSIRIFNLFGTSLIEDVTFNDMNEDGIEYINNSTDDGIRDVLTVRRGDFNNHLAANGESAVQAESQLSSNMGLVVDDSDFDINSNGILGVLASSTGNSHFSVTVQNSTFNAGNAFGAGTIQVTNASNSTGTNIVAGNTINNAPLTGILVKNDDNATSSATISNNVIDGSGVGVNNGFGIETTQDENGSFTVLIDNNSISQMDVNQIRITARDTTDGSGILNATVTNNTAQNPPGDFIFGFEAIKSENNTLCLDLRGNNFQGNDGGFPGFGDDIRLSQTGSNSFNVEQSSAANISSLNNGDTVSIGGTINFSSANCPLP